VPKLAYIIAEPCIGVKDSACVEVCPVDCIYSTEDDDMYYIHPEECIDCAMCEPECPVEAIFFEDDLPQEWDDYVGINDDYDYANASTDPGL
jgi:ferredoxin